MVDQKWRLRAKDRETMPLGMTCKPWYKDNLPSKCFTKQKKKLYQFPTALDGRHWVFVKEGLDDFRKGCPSAEGLIVRGAEDAFLPIIGEKVPQLGSRKSQRKLEDTSLWTTLSSTQIARIAFMRELDEYLAQNPSALYSTLEDFVPPDQLLKALKVLDPGRKFEDTWDYCEGRRERTKKPTKLPKQSTKGFQLPEITDPCRYSAFQEEKVNKLYFLSGVTRDYMLQVIRDFCRWTATLGDFGISESDLLERFDIGFKLYQTYKDENKIKKIRQIPSEIRSCKELNKLKKVIFTIEETDFERKLPPKSPYLPKCDKIRYGGWYLKPKLCRKLVNNKPLIDPKILAEAMGEPPPDILEELYGPLAFKDFIVNHGYSMPGILEKLFTRKGWSYNKYVTPHTKSSGGF